MRMSLGSPTCPVEKTTKPSMSILVIHPVEHFLSHCCRVLCDGIHIHSTECQPQPQGDSMSNSGRFTTMEEKRKDHQRSEGTFFFGHLLVVSKEKIGSLSHTQIIVKVYHCFRSIPSLSNNSSGTKTKNKTLLDWYKNGNAFGGESWSHLATPWWLRTKRPSQEALRKLRRS